MTRGKEKNIPQLCFLFILFSTFSQCLLLTEWLNVLLIFALLVTISSPLPLKGNDFDQNDCLLKYNRRVMTSQSIRSYRAKISKIINYLYLPESFEISKNRSKFLGILKNLGNLFEFFCIFRNFWKSIESFSEYLKSLRILSIVKIFILSESFIVSLNLQSPSCPPCARLLNSFERGRLYFGYSAKTFTLITRISAPPTLISL